MTLHLYFARKFLWIFLGVSFVFLMLMMLIEFVDLLSRFDRDIVSFANVVELTVLDAPSSVYNILPLVMILSTVAMFLGLARTSELVATRAAGRSALRSLISPMLVAILLGVLVGFSVLIVRGLPEKSIKYVDDQKDKLYEKLIDKIQSLEYIELINDIFLVYILYAWKEWSDGSTLETFIKWVMNDSDVGTFMAFINKFIKIANL